MYHYEYVTKNEAKPYREEFLNIIHRTQDLLRNRFTFQYDFIGSSSRNMITCDFTTNKGFDFDINLHINDPDEEFSAEEIKKSIIGAINKVARPRGYEFCEDSTRVITLKMLSKNRSQIEYSCDFAIVNDYEDENGIFHQQYIHFGKNGGSYTWCDQPQGYKLEDKVIWLVENKLWNEVRELYLYKKNNNLNLEKKSRAIYAETIHEVCQKNGY